jgi:hypothetical protein
MKNFIKLKIITLVILLLFIFSCNDLNEKHIIGRYYLDTVDYVEELMSLYFKYDDGNSIGVVNQTVFAVGFNEKYIVVKQHPDNNKKITNFYIVPIYKEETYWPEKGLLGPLTFEQFQEKRKELNLTNVEFTIIKESLK